MATHLLRLGGYIPPASTPVARSLWAAGVRARELLEEAEQLGDAFGPAWRSCHRFEILVPLALVLTHDVGRIVHALGRCLDLTLEQLGDLGWDQHDRQRVRLIRVLIIDLDPATEVLVAARDAALEHAGRRGAGRHRYRLLTASAHLASLALQRSGFAPTAAFDASLIVEHLVGALEDASEGADLFTYAPDVATFRLEAETLLRAELRMLEEAYVA